MANNSTRSERQLDRLQEARSNNMDRLKGNQRANQGDSIVTNLDQLKFSTLHRNSRRSTKWFENKINGKGIDKKMIKDRVRVGRMYMFAYQAKGDGTAGLPFWDRNPLIIPIKPYSDGFLAMNLHYLHPNIRLVLLQKLDKFAKGSGEQKRLALTYELLRHASNMKEFKPCIKRYLYSHTRTKFALVPANEWEIAASMPLANFKGASKDHVYSQSQRAYRR